MLCERTIEDDERQSLLLLVFTISGRYTPCSR